MKNKTTIIAEIGQAHDGSLGILHSLIDAAASAGVDAVKFQVHIADSESTLHEPFRINFSYEDKNRFEYWKRMEFTFKQWQDIKKKCEDSNVEFLATPFSNAAVDLLEALEVRRYKIGSGEFNNLLLIDKIIKTKKEILFSTGMSTIEEIEIIVERIKKAGNKLCIFQCTSSYPTNPSEVCLGAIPQLKEKFNCNIGLSDHSGDIFACLGAVSLGATFVEVHITFSQKMFGPDSFSSLNIENLTKLVKGIRFIEEAKRGDLSNKNLRNYSHNRAIFGRSLYLNQNLKKNEKLNFDYLEAKKSGKIGISPIHYEKVLEKKAKRNLKKGSQIKFEDFTL